MISVGNCTAALQHLVAATLAEGRGVPATELVDALASCDHLRYGDAELDSLEQLTVARRVAEFFELEKAGVEELLLRRHRLQEWSEIITGPLNDGTLSDLWFRSGGTTGDPKTLPQTLARLESEVRELSKQLPETKRIVALVPLHHIYGFIWGPLLSDRLGVPLVHGNLAVHAVHHDLRAGDLVLGVPEWWHYLSHSNTTLPAGVTGVTSTAPTPVSTINTLLDKGLASMIEVYGSTETAGIGWRDTVDDAFKLFSHWSRHDDDHLESLDGSLHPLPDIVQWPTPRSLRPIKRRDNAIQVGGVNVWPERVREFVESHPSVEACAIRPMATEQGARLKAFIVPTADRPDAAELRTELSHWLKDELPAAERPINLTFGDKLPRSSAGKLCDW